MTVADRIRDEEGWRPHVYSDSLGFATIGYGFLIDSRRGEGLPKEVADFWLASEIAKTERSLTDWWMPFLSQPPDVRDALTEMAFQLGVDGVLGFHTMLAALERGDRASAATAALDSKWHNQTPARAERVTSLLRGST